MQAESDFWTKLREFKQSSLQDAHDSPERLHKSLDAFRAMARHEQLEFQADLDTVLSELNSLRTLIRSIIAMK